MVLGGGAVSFERGTLEGCSQYSRVVPFPPRTGVIHGIACTRRGDNLKCLRDLYLRAHSGIWIDWRVYVDQVFKKSFKFFSSLGSGHGGSVLRRFSIFPLNNGSSQSQNPALTVLCVPSSVDTGLSTIHRSLGFDTDFDRRLGQHTSQPRSLRSFFFFFITLKPRVE